MEKFQQPFIPKGDSEDAPKRQSHQTDSQDDVSNNGRESSKNLMFRRELLAFVAVSTLEEARSISVDMEALPDIPEDSGAGQSGENSFENRCQFCHQPIERRVRITTGENVGLIGTDCALKLRNFQHTGEVKSVTESPAKRRRDFEEIANQLLTTEEADLLKKADTGQEKRNNPFVSMLTWSRKYLQDHPEEIPEHIRRILREIEIFDAPENAEDSQEFVVWYTETRKLAPREILTSEEEDLLETHPHRGMLEKILDANPDRSIEETQRILRIVSHYKEKYEETDKYLSSLVKEGLILQLDYWETKKTNSFTSRNGTIYKMKDLFALYVWERNVPTPQNPLFAIRHATLPKDRGHMDVYAYRGLPKNVSPTGAEFLIEKRRRFLFAPLSGEKISLHDCDTVVVDNYGKAIVLDGDKIVSEDLGNYITEHLPRNSQEK